MSTRVEISSNVFPAITVFDSSSEPSALAKLLKFGVVVDVSGVRVIDKPAPPVNQFVFYGVASIILGSLIFASYKLA